MRLWVDINLAGGGELEVRGVGACRYPSQAPFPPQEEVGSMHIIVSVFPQVRLDLIKCKTHYKHPFYPVWVTEVYSGSTNGFSSDSSKVRLGLRSDMIASSVDRLDGSRTRKRLRPLETNLTEKLKTVEIGRKGS